ncbi:ABC transporter ATP-binding protein [Clostridium aminobutyricum]|uniref:ABC transporter ATP-binding protein n=2 Tax=Clostridium aminobutyricum TaxID=33953 RepID=A0A939IH22_CLOAM|nr:ABC transporter ATP-binding protein [Clostridium aminobutyricum]
MAPKKEQTAPSAPRQRRGPEPGGGPANMMPGEKAKNFKSTMKNLLKYFKPFQFQMGVVILFAVASTVFSIVSPTILGDATDVIVSGFLQGGIDFDKMRNILTLLIVLYLISFIFSMLQSYIMAGVAQRITYRLRKEISEKLDRLPLKYFDEKTHGEILSRVTNDVETVNQSLAQSLTQTITSIASVVGVLVMMLTISVRMTVAALIALPLSMLLIKLVVHFSQPHFKNQQKYLGEMNGHVEEMYTGHLIVKAFNKEDDSIKTFNELNNKLYNSVWKSQFLSGMMMPLIGFVGNLAYVFVCVVGGYLALKGQVTIGNIQAFMQYVRSFNQPIQQISNIANVFQATAAAAERVFELLDEKEELDSIVPEARPGENQAQNKDGLTGKKQGRGAVSFEQVRFGYDPGDMLIHDFSFEVKPGQRIAIVGPTGAGKTTLVKLLLRFYELNGGRILIDGKNSTDYTRAELRNLFGMVLQDTWLFNGTIMENIRYGKYGATDEEVYAAAKAAQVDHFIKTQPKGYQMEITEEANNISQGEKQLLTIARAFLADAPILILDEATSSVDTRTELQIQRAMSNLMKNRTSFVIAHRLSTIKDADIILVVDHGDIVEYGNHEELLAKGGFYSTLYNSQF